MVSVIDYMLGSLLAVPQDLVDIPRLQSYKCVSDAHSGRRFCLVARLWRRVRKREAI
jgi:hypothetical protein